MPARRLLVLLVILAAALPFGGANGAPALVTEELAFEADDGTVLHAVVGGVGGLQKRPLIVESSPYAPGCCDTFAGPGYNYVQLHWRGTGRSGGAFQATGPRDQQDLSQFLGWACKQPWSDGRIGLYGFSASAIAAYNAMHLPLPCVQAAALMSGTVDLYRDLLYIGGINNAVPGLVVEAGIGGPWLANVPNNRQPPTVLDGGKAFLDAPMDVNAHPTYDAHWRDRTFKGNRNKIPILAGVGFYDVESRGAFEAYKANRRYGSHLLVMGAHDGWPKNTPGPFPSYARWFDRYVRGIRNGIDAEPRASLFLSNGSHKELTEGRYTKLSGSDWPLPSTRYSRYYLTSPKSGTALSINDGTLSRTPMRREVTQTYPFVPSDGLATDPHTVSTVIGGAGGLEPPLTDLRITEPTSLTYTTAPFTSDVNMAGPASLDVFVSSVQQVTDLNVVIADVWPDGSSHPVASGELRTSYPEIDASRTVYDKVTGDIVQPYTDYSSVSRATPLSTREYHVEILPIGNRFAEGHRLRLYVTGTSAAKVGSAPGANTVSIGGVTPSRLILPTIG